MTSTRCHTGERTETAEQSVLDGCDKGIADLAARLRRRALQLQDGGATKTDTAFGPALGGGGDEFGHGKRLIEPEGVGRGAVALVMLETVAAFGDGGEMADGNPP